MTFAQILLELRKEHQMTQEELAFELEVSRQAVSRWEMGKAYPDSVNLLKIAQLFQVTTDYLLDNHADKKEEVSVDFRDVYQKKINSKIKYGNLGEFLLLCIMCAVVKGNAEFFITAGVLIFISFMASGVFRYILNTEGYDLLSGVNTKKYRYDYNLLKKVIMSLEFVFIINGFVISNVIMILGLLNTLPQKQGDMCILICGLFYGIGTLIVILKLSTRIKPIQPVKVDE